jgi:hypothetical protein
MDEASLYPTFFDLMAMERTGTTIAGNSTGSSSQVEHERMIAELKGSESLRLHKSLAVGRVAKETSVGW